MRKLIAVLTLMLAPSVALASTAQEGVPLKVRRGFFTATDIGGFFTVGGLNGYSNFQAYLQLGAGYQFAFGAGEKVALPIGFHVAIASNASNCYQSFLPDGVTCSQPDNFTLTFLTLSAGAAYNIIERVYVGGKLLGGYTLLDPAPFVSGSGTNRRQESQGPHFGVAANIEYFTNMDHFAVGFDADYRMVIAGSGIHCLAFLVRVKYTF